MGGHVTGAVTALASELPDWVTLLRAPNPGPMTLDGTNTWLLRARPGEPAVVVDPGPADEAHLAAIVAQGPVGLVLITHGHPDHTEGSARLHALLDGADVLAADPAHTIGGVPLTGPGQDLAGFGLDIRLLATPGHTADSVCFLAERDGQRLILTGDTILGRGTTVVAHPDGHLGDYLTSLELLSTYRGMPALPGHGPALADCGAAADFYLAHRRARLDQVRTALDAGARTAAEVVAVVYADVDRSLWWAAEWSVRAQLEYLGRESDGGDARLDPA
ncbi:MBL fold metallo-hydrolase [Verrucosispora sp. WMMA2044]|uniref:MBL fold metallo-hydrolase n=1 Tax=Verrucosispora sioxanthis TaxID=2499994 RepID=A0A6M1LDA4_9ACTN|nr:MULTISPECIES: MBL fold metallo-hydrolase [Micromonospora]NEE67097.1 MBL fold metallo-hydrolase [Verrucosispora sioxanthis]NGM16207.1 MBL fold metallo-hydrolase [Verrucosispora sioxanthis]WBB48707.1 MBL fold metallo-hydrolase [Verrucosispora sp. WMMA2044]